MDRLDRFQGQAMPCCPVEKLVHGPAISLAGVFIADLSGKELDDSSDGFVAGVVQYRW